MKTKLSIFIIAISLLGCNSSEKNKKDNQQQKLDSIEEVNNQSIIDSGDNVTKGYVMLSDSSFSLTSDMKKDHRFYGYAKPDLTSKKLILFSIFTDDVDDNPFNLPLGAYYDTTISEELSLKYTGVENGFVKFNALEKNQLVYFEKKWIVFDEDNDYDTNDDLVREFGLIEKIEDSGYPIFIITVNFVERRFKQDFKLNIENLSSNDSQLQDYLDKYATIYYTSEEENNLFDIYYQGKSTSGKYAPELDGSEMKMTGTLSADSLSGDLPSTIYVTDSNQRKAEFKWFVDDELLNLNNKEVTVYYNTRYTNTIVRLKPSSEE